MDTIFLLEHAIIEELDNAPMLMAFVGTLIDDWLENLKSILKTSKMIHCLS